MLDSLYATTVTKIGEMGDSSVVVLGAILSLTLFFTGGYLVIKMVKSRRPSVG